MFYFPVWGACLTKRKEQPAAVGPAETEVGSPSVAHVGTYRVDQSYAVVYHKHESCSNRLDRITVLGYLPKFRLADTSPIYSVHTEVIHWNRGG